MAILLVLKLHLGAPFSPELCFARAPRRRSETSPTGQWEEREINPLARTRRPVPCSPKAMSIKGTRAASPAILAIHHRMRVTGSARLFMGIVDSRDLVQCAR